MAHSRDAFKALMAAGREKARMARAAQEQVLDLRASGETPKFDPERLALQTFGPEGLCHIQQTHLFNASGRYLREVPPEQAYITTEEMERNNARDRAKWKAKTRGFHAAQKADPIPDTLMRASQENARALAAERYSE